MATLTLSGRPLPVVGRARVYVCGVTPYDVTHVGHAATFVWADVATRVLRHLGVATEVCRNVTDIDDVLFDAAHRAGERYERLAVVQEYHFEQDMELLGVRRPEHQPRAHAYITAVQQLADALLASGAAYESGGSVYLPGRPVAVAAGLTPEEALGALTGIGGSAQDPAKRDPLDQPMWQRSLGEEPAWPSPWGPGRPGWHAECTAMALTVLGAAVDLHVGGADLRFPHHAFETAAAEAATGVTPFARAWMHVGVVSQDGAKMAKSTGNLTFVADLVEEFGAAAVRLLLLDRAYDTGWEYRTDDLAAAAARVDSLHAAAARPGVREEAAGEAVTAALCAGLDVPTALAVAEEEGGAAARTALTVLGLTG